MRPYTHTLTLRLPHPPQLANLRSSYGEASAPNAANACALGHSAVRPQPSHFSFNRSVEAITRPRFSKSGMPEQRQTQRARSDAIGVQPGRMLRLTGEVLRQAW